MVRKNREKEEEVLPDISHCKWKKAQNPAGVKPKTTGTWGVCFTSVLQLLPLSITNKSICECKKWWNFLRASSPTTHYCKSVSKDVRLLSGCKMQPLTLIRDHLLIGQKRISVRENDEATKSINAVPRSATRLKLFCYICTQIINLKHFFALDSSVPL